LSPRSLHDALPILDAGPAYGPSADAGERVLLPYLRASGVPRLNLLVVTHGDADHAGGAASVLDGIPVSAVMTGDDSASVAKGEPRRCIAGDAWQWDGVLFRVLHPAADETRLRKSNDRACVLRIEADGGAVLVASDIEKAAERAL